jgi:hypothetical protein
LGIETNIPAAEIEVCSKGIEELRDHLGRRGRDLEFAELEPVSRTSVLIDLTGSSVVRSSNSAPIDTIWCTRGFIPVVSTSKTNMSRSKGCDRCHDGADAIKSDNGAFAPLDEASIYPRTSAVGYGTAMKLHVSASFRLWPKICLKSRSKRYAR